LAFTLGAQDQGNGITKILRKGGKLLNGTEEKRGVKKVAEKATRRLPKRLARERVKRSLWPKDSADKQK